MMSQRAAYFSPGAEIRVRSAPVLLSMEKKSEMPLPSPAESPTSAATTSGSVETTPAYSMPLAILYSEITLPVPGSMVWMLSWRAWYVPHLRTATSFGPPP
ncbi:hypothetical protein SFUMM280S_02612 [Streptomyces fumanus]